MRTQPSSSRKPRRPVASAVGPRPHLPFGGESPSAALVPRTGDGHSASLPVIARAARSCTACPLYAKATQTVFGEGPERAPIMLVGEQPGDAEDVAGRPFVGPAGRMLDKALAEVGLDRAAVYVTNAVKHFNFTQDRPGGKRLHAKPKGRDVKACAGWLGAELDRVRPGVVVALGATAAQALLGSGFRLTEARGVPQERDGLPVVFATYHPSALLRAPDADTRRAMYEAFVTDLRAAAGFVRGRAR
jgi:uracil-DNA glycosylase